MATFERVGDSARARVMALAWGVPGGNAVVGGVDGELADMPFVGRGY